MKDKKNIIIIAAVAIVILSAVAYWWFTRSRPSQAPARSLADQNAPMNSTGTAGSLGGEIYEKSQNPIKDKIETSNPLKNANPLEGAYQNPFE